MILSFLGKGGSGKSSLSTQMTLFLNQDSLEVLAIDADHNLDLSFNLNYVKEIESHRHFGSALSEIQEFLGLSKDEKYDQAFLKNKFKNFYFGQAADAFSAKYSSLIKERLYLMTAGPQTDEVLHGKACSHILSTPLKMYLPLLKLKDNQVVVVDEKAGADGVSTGIISGADVAIIAIEPALHSIKTALQLIELLKFYETPYLLVANKINTEEDLNFINSKINENVNNYLSFSTQIQKEPGKLDESYLSALKNIYQQAKKINKDNRLERSVKKFQRNSAFA
jgi:CO dehydrogenase nickel-insertion accessory protein CooC1